MQDQKTRKQNPEMVAIEVLPEIPDKRYFTIGEVGKLCLVKPHVLRYWEQEFSQLRPAKRRGNRRYYQLKDVMLIRKIRHLLYNQGFTISGAKGQLSGDEPSKAASSTERQTQNTAVIDIVSDLEELIALLDGD